MIEYIYFVKCPNCEDEHFDFFNEAKDFAMSCLSKKPVITQTEVNRNDFGECTDHSDLGTIWSWEEVMKDVPAEPEATVFSKSETFDCKCGGNCKCHHDPEFEDIDFSADSEFPLDEGMNRAEQEELMKLCRELGIETPGQLQDLAKALDLPGRTPLEKLRSYAARLSDDAAVTEDDDMITLNGTRIHFINRSDLDEFTRLCAKYDIDRNNIETFMDDREVMNWNNGQEVLDALREYDEEVQSLPENLKAARKPVPEGMSLKDLVEAMEENEDTVECAGCEELFPKDECTHKDGIGYLCYDCEDRVVKCTWCEELYDRSECRREVDLGWLCSRCEMGIKSRGETLTFREGSYWDDLDEEVTEPEALRDLGNEYDGGYPDEVPEIDEVSDFHLSLCPECGKDSYDVETGICIDCGFN